MMTMIEWGISPGQVMPKQRLTGINYFTAKEEGFIFANYETPGAHELTINQNHISFMFMILTERNYMDFEDLFASIG